MLSGCQGGDRRQHQPPDASELAGMTEDDCFKLLSYTNETAANTNIRLYKEANEKGRSRG